MVVRGADGCKGGWVVATLKVDELSVECTVELSEFLDVDRFLIDMPIGLPESGPRRADIEARGVIGPRRSSVFPTPLRRVTGCPTYALANQLSKGTNQKGLSKQTYMLFPKICEIDALIQSHNCVNVGEGHPELSFFALNGAVCLDQSKHTFSGLQQRFSLLKDQFGPAVSRALKLAKGGVKEDDILDAIALAWSARRWALGEHQEVPEVPEFDAMGLPMRMIF